jgi:hypothetical protein
MDVAVSLVAAGISVAGGTVVMEGRSESLAQEIVAIPSRAFPALVFGYLVRERATDSLLLFVDEHVQDGVDAGYTFERDGPYALLAYLFRVTVPAGTTDLRGLTYDRWRIISEQ